MADPRTTDPQRAGAPVPPAADDGIRTHDADRIERERRVEPGAPQGAEALMGTDAVPRDPETGAAGTTLPRSATPTGSTRPSAVVPPRRGETKWLAIAAAGAVGVILILLVLT